jgi:hypothetical protein
MNALPNFFHVEHPAAERASLRDDHAMRFQQMKGPT